MERELDVATALDLQGTDDVDARRAQQLILLIGERLRGSDDDRIARVNADRVDVLHVADDDAIVGPVAQNFVLDLLPAEERGLDERLMVERGFQTDFERRAHLALGVNDAAARAAERVGRPDDERVAGLGAEGDAGRDVVHDDASRDRLTDFDHLLLEGLAVFGEDDRGDRRAEHVDVVTREHARAFEFDGEIEAGLAAERRQQRIRPFVRDDRLQRGDGQWLDVDGVGDLGIRHDRRGVRVDEDDPVAFFPQRATRLDACVIEFGGLADDDRTRADHEDAAGGRHDRRSTARASTRPSASGDQARCRDVRA